MFFCAKRKIEARDGRRGDLCATYDADVPNGEFVRVADIASAPVLVFARRRCEDCGRPELIWTSSEESALADADDD